jgi:energy-coupling factor transporter transmembrane protein EcfT
MNALIRALDYRALAITCVMGVVILMVAAAGICATVIFWAVVVGGLVSDMGWRFFAWPGAGTAAVFLCAWAFRRTFNPPVG